MRYIFKYVKKPSRGKYAVVLVAADPSCPEKEPTVGWSMCCKKDVWDKHFGVTLALARASCKRFSIPLSQALQHLGGKIPESLKDELERIVERGKRYFMNDHETPVTIQ